MKKYYRVKSCEVGLGLDNMMMASVGVGLVFWQQPVNLADRGPPAEWPRLTITVDQGSDGAAMLFALTRHVFNLNVDVRYHPNHGAWNDLRGALKAVG